MQRKSVTPKRTWCQHVAIETKLDPMPICDHFEVSLDVDLIDMPGANRNRLIVQRANIDSGACATATMMWPTVVHTTHVGSKPSRVMHISTERRRQVDTIFISVLDAFSLAPFQEQLVPRRTAK